MSTISNLRNLEDVAPHVRWEKYVCAILESPSRTCFVSRGEAQRLRLEDFRTGLLFGETAELRFRKRRGGKYHLVYIDDQDGSLDGGETLTLEAGSGPVQIFLWGEALGNHWYEARIPGELSYPIDSGWRAAVRVKHYRMNSPKTVNLFRCCGLETRDQPQAREE